MTDQLSLTNHLLLFIAGEIVGLGIMLIAILARVLSTLSDKP